MADTGPGVDPRDLPHLFSPLYRGKISRSREIGGPALASPSPGASCKPTAAT